MTKEEWAALGLELRDVVHRSEFLHEVRQELRQPGTEEYIAFASATIKITNNEQQLNAGSQFILRDYLTRKQIDAIIEWLPKTLIEARWRLTTYTIMVEAAE